LLAIAADKPVTNILRLKPPSYNMLNIHISSRSNAVCQHTRIKKALFGNVQATEQTTFADQAETFMWSVNHPQ
jgi:hypothetical protein